MVRSPFRYKKPPKDASVVRGVFHPPGSKKSPAKSDRDIETSASDGLESTEPAAHTDEDQPSDKPEDEHRKGRPQQRAKQETRHQHAGGHSQLPSNASGIIQRYLSPNSSKPRDADAIASSSHPGDSDNPSSAPRRAKVKSVYLGGRTIIGESSVPIASLQEPEPKTVKSRCGHRTAKDARKRPRTCISSANVPPRASTMSSLDSLPARSSEGGSPQIEEDLEAGRGDESNIDRQIVSAPCGFQTGVKRVSSADAAKKRRLSKRARTRLTMREVNTTVQPGRHYSSLESMAHLEKAKALTIPKTIDFFRRVEVKLIVVNTLLSALLTAFVLYAIPGVWQRNLAGSSPAVSVLGAFLSFALVFRTQTCYTRWWEGRTQWGRMTSAVVNLAGQARAWFGDEDLADRFLVHCVVFSYACKAVLRGNQLHDPTEEGPRFLHSGMVTDADLGAIVRHGRPPFACLEILRRATYEALREENGCLLPPELTHGAFLAMEHVLWELNLNFGACLKINGTRMPASYTVFVRSFVLFYFVLASLVWAPQIQWLTPVIVGFCLFLINTVLIIGDQMLKPFELQWGALPLQKFCTIMEHEIMNVPRRHADINCLFT